MAIGAAGVRTPNRISCKGGTKARYGTKTGNIPPGELLGQSHSGHLACTKDEVDQHLHDTFSDPIWNQELGQ